MLNLNRSLDPGLPTIHLGRAICGDLTAATRREWLLTNGLGGYACGTVAGMPTRSYHSLLMATLTPPVDRVVVVGGLHEQVTYLGRRYDLDTLSYDAWETEGGWSAASPLAAEGPAGYRHCQAFTLTGTIPTWVYACADALIARTIWMVAEQNCTVIRYTVLRASAEVALVVAPLLTARDLHALAPRAADWTPHAEIAGDTAQIALPLGMPPLRLSVDGGLLNVYQGRVRAVHYAAERERGLADRGDLWLAARVDAAALTTGQTVTLTCALDGALPWAVATDTADPARTTLAAELARQRALLARADVAEADVFARHLVLAADQCIVARDLGIASATDDGLARAAGEPVTTAAAAREIAVLRRGTTIIAGYPWFNDWGRDTMIALPGLTLATGRPADAMAILRTFARWVRDGLLPNNFPDSAGTIPGYNTVDATLWYVVAIWRTVAATGDLALARDLWPVLVTIIDQHTRGTQFGIGVDPADGLLRQGGPGWQLTWMDVKIGDWVVTPRTGKPVEINALWHSVLRIMAALARRLADEPAAASYDAEADRARASFIARFVPADPRPEPAEPEATWHLADVVDGPDGDDWSLRPNQIFAVSLPFALLDGDAARAVTASVGQTLLTSVGLRTLAPDDPRYRGIYSGGPAERDAVYHQGTVWAWLIGAYAEAVWRTSGDANAARAILAPLYDHLSDACLGSISEISDGDPPHTPRGAFAQAWSIAEVLRVWRALADDAR